MFTTGLREFKAASEKTNLLMMKLFYKLQKTIVQYVIAILFESKLVDNKEQARLEVHYDFNHEDIMKEIESYFII